METGSIVPPPPFRPVEMTRDRGKLCRAVLEGLPEWFGRPAALDAYVEGAESMTMLASFAEDGAPAGFLSLNDQTAFATEIYVMGVTPAMHRRGIGRGLIEATGHQAARRGARFLTVKTLGPEHPDPNYATTRRFYEATGFIPVETFPTLWGAETPCLMMIMAVPVASRETDTAEIERLERRLLQADARASEDAVAAILADDFMEFGGSGLIFDKDETLRGLAADAASTPGPDREGVDFRLRMRGDTAALLIYRVERQPPDAAPVVSLRSSVWQKSGGRWRMIFHQGTGWHLQK